MKITIFPRIFPLRFPQKNPKRLLRVFRQRPEARHGLRQLRRRGRRRRRRREGVLGGALPALTEDGGHGDFMAGLV